MVADAGASALDWLDPEAWGAPDATFVNCHIILSAGRRPGDRS